MVDGFPGEAILQLFQKELLNRGPAQVTEALLAKTREQVFFQEMRVDFLRSEWPSSTLARFCEAVDGRKITVKAVSDKRDTGMHFASDGLEWKLRSDLARDFADKVEVLASSTSGHQYLDCYYVTDGITVEVSIGEYPDSLHSDR